ncbi:MAG: short-chain dehydrogenase/reductase [Tardiphaga sp.]|nr:short-chain dehydrogenase/reductase [Tardiphaga sp.]
MRTSQTPIGSGFGPYTTTTDVIAGCDLAGKVAVVTGGYSGLGLETAKILAAAGARVIVPARDPDKAKRALQAMPDIALESLDLMDPASIDGFAERFLATGQALHLLVNSAGFMSNDLVRDSRGYESQFSTNHLGHFQLTGRLLPALRQAGGARVVAVSSRGHRFGGIDFDDPNFERRDYDRWAAYAQSKTANALFALSLDELGKSHGVRAFSVHPGTIMTDFARNATKEELRSFGIFDEEGRLIIDPVRGAKTVEQGTATIVWCATTPQLDGRGGVYCEDCDIAGENESREAGAGVRPWAADPEFADRLWQLSEQLTGGSFAG